MQCDFWCLWPSSLNTINKEHSVEHQTSSLNLVSRALSIDVQAIDVEVNYWVEESIDFKLVSFQYTSNQSLEDWLLIVKVSGVTCFVDVQLLTMYLLCYARQDLVIEDSQEVVSFSSAHWLLYFGNRHILVTGASLPNDHYRFLAINILLLWSITQRRRLFTTPIEPINCIISESVGWYQFMLLACLTSLWFSRTRRYYTSKFI